MVTTALLFFVEAKFFVLPTAKDSKWQFDVARLFFLCFDTQNEIIESKIWGLQKAFEVFIFAVRKEIGFCLPVSVSA